MVSIFHTVVTTRYALTRNGYADIADCIISDQLCLTGRGLFPRERDDSLDREKDQNYHLTRVLDVEKQNRIAFIVLDTCHKIGPVAISSILRSLSSIVQA